MQIETTKWRKRRGHFLLDDAHTHRKSPLKSVQIADGGPAFQQFLSIYVSDEVLDKYPGKYRQGDKSFDNVPNELDCLINKCIPNKCKEFSYNKEQKKCLTNDLESQSWRLTAESGWDHYKYD